MKQSQYNNTDALSRRPCKVCLRHQERNTEEKSEPQSTEIFKNWEPEEIRELIS